MPELPDIVVYIEALSERIIGQPIEKVRVGKPFFIRSFEPPIAQAQDRTVKSLQRIGKRIVIELSSDLFIVIHLMIAGRLHFQKRGAKLSRKNGLCAFDFPQASLVITEAGTKRRASLHIVRGRTALKEHDPGGLEVLAATKKQFAATLNRENHTLKRSLTDPRLFSGIGNAYSDEILHRAKLSPLKWTSRLTTNEIDRLFKATQKILNEWTERLRAECGEGFPNKVTAFRPEMAVHGRFKKPCPVCSAPVQRIVRGDSEINYCAKCQTGGKLLADRALSKLLKGDWPKTLDELDGLMGR